MGRPPLYGRREPASPPDGTVDQCLGAARGPETACDLLTEPSEATGSGALIARPCGACRRVGADRIVADRTVPSRRARRARGHGHSERFPHDVSRDAVVADAAFMAERLSPAPVVVAAGSQMRWASGRRSAPAQRPKPFSRSGSAADRFLDSFAAGASASTSTSPRTEIGPASGE